MNNRTLTGQWREMTSRQVIEYMVSADGFEPSTHALKA